MTVESINPENPGMTLSQLSDDLSSRLSEDGRLLVNIAKTLLELQEKQSKIIDENNQINKFNNINMEMLTKEVSRLQKEVVDISKEKTAIENELTEAKFEIERLKIELQTKNTEECEDCHMSSEYREGGAELDRMVDAAMSLVQEKQDSQLFTLSEAQHYIELLSHGDPKVRLDTCRKLGIYSSTPTPILHEDDLVFLNSTISKEEDQHE